MTITELRAALRGLPGDTLVLMPSHMRGINVDPELRQYLGVQEAEIAEVSDVDGSAVYTRAEQPGRPRRTAVLLRVH